jgi:molybdopterin-containing oxidoreductase family iron-sulfur binding subunit
MSRNDLTRDAVAHPHTHREVPGTDPAPDAGSLEAAVTADRGLNRRDFLRVTTTIAAGSALAAAGCQQPVETLVPLNQRPEGMRSVGRPLFYASVLDGVPFIARTREGRPILVAPNPAHPSRTPLTVRTQAALLDLYDPDRVQQPLSVRRGTGSPAKTTWAAVSDEVVRGLKASRDRVALLVRPATGAATRAAYDEFARATGARIVEWEAFQPDAAVEAWRQAFGDARIPTPRLDRASLVVGLGADFLDIAGDRREADFADRRDPGHPDGMGRFIAFESRLTLTGANADRRIRVRDSHLPAIACALAHQVIQEGGVGPLASDLDVADALKPFAIDTITTAVGVPADVLRGVAAELRAAGPKAIVLAGLNAGASAGGLALETAVHLLNASLGAYGSTFDLDAWGAPPTGGLKALADLVADLDAGRIDVLIVAGPNPVHDAPASLKVAEAFAKARLVVSLNDRLDETSRLADWLAPASHPFEAWADASFPGDVHTIQQPLLRPLYATWGLLDVLLAWAAQAGAGGDIADAMAATRPAVDPKAPAPNTSPAWHWIRAWWARNFFGTDVATPEFEDAWDETLRAGFWTSPSSARSLPSFNTGAVSLLADAAPAAASLVELHLHPHFAHLDGRSANNGWLHELPDPLTRITWGDWIAIAPRRFDAMGLKNGDLVKVTSGGASVTLPSYRHAGLHADVVAIPLGLGRTAAGLAGNGIGRATFPLAPLVGGRVLRVGLSCEIAKAGGSEELAITQGSEVLDREARQLLPAATLKEVRADPQAGTEQEGGGPSIWPDRSPDKQRWAMAIDLSKCNGCGKCTLGCQAENNIPVVGPRGVLEGREMAWIRVDRYWDAGRDKDWDDTVWDGPLAVVEEPRTLFQPMLCQHCENAPCETVCPFVATMHSEDGLNQQVYNRCVGTRYCSNNCPFKVRRYNWLEYSYGKTNPFFRMLVPKLAMGEILNVRGRLPMKNNPEVTVRHRGVMEKCSFCVQRIREARATATREGRKLQIHDGEVVPACMEACPTGAITFGNVLDPEARVRRLADSPRAMRLLRNLGVKPSISYLTRVRNDDGQV